jgi:hypothetical protein
MKASSKLLPCSRDISARGQMDVKIFNVFSRCPAVERVSVPLWLLPPLHQLAQEERAPVHTPRSGFQVYKSFGQFFLTRRIFINRKVTKRTVERSVELGNFPRVSLDLCVKFFIL